MWWYYEKSLILLIERAAWFSQDTWATNVTLRCIFPSYGNASIDQNQSPWSLQLPTELETPTLRYAAHSSTNWTTEAIDWDVFPTVATKVHTNKTTIFQRKCFISVYNQPIVNIQWSLHGNQLLALFKIENITCEFQVYIGNKGIGLVKKEIRELLHILHFNNLTKFCFFKLFNIFAFNKSSYSVMQIKLYTGSFLYPCTTCRTKIRPTNLF